MTLGRVIALVLLHVAFATAILVAGIRLGHAEPVSYRAVTLLCATEVATSSCDRSTALDILATVPVPTPFACMMGGMSAAAHMHELASAGYVKIVCEAR